MAGQGKTLWEKRRSSDRYEFFFRGAVMLDLALADVMPQPMHRQVALGDRVAHKGKGHQVFEADDDGLFFQRLRAFEIILDILYPIIARAQDIHPSPDEAGGFVEFRRVARAHLLAALDAAAIGMAQH